VPPRCTCGAVLPEDARFCHKCGKPQFEETADAVDAEQTLEAVQIPPGLPSARPNALQTGISFKNSRAVVISLIVAAGAMVCFFPIALLAPPLFPIFLCAVGFVAVRIYKGRSAESLSTSAGARLGWMTGLWIFLVFAVLLALSAIMVANSELWQQLQTTWAKLPQTAPLTSLSQHDFLVRLLVMFPFLFFLFTLLPGLGGILGAKFPWRKRPS
jgi:lysylphosphatidylglycerol synthetase-like protein (DUF2156 family)